MRTLSTTVVLMLLMLGTSELSAQVSADVYVAGVIK